MSKGKEKEEEGNKPVDEPSKDSKAAADATATADTTSWSNNTSSTSSSSACRQVATDCSPSDPCTSEINQQLPGLR